MVWELLTLMGAVAFLWAAVQTARQAHAGIAGYATVIVIGLLGAAGYEITAHKVAHAIDEHLKTRSEAYKKWFLRGVYTCSAILPLVAAALGSYVSEKLLRLV
jgi:hypothetical protein